MGFKEKETMATNGNKYYLINDELFDWHNRKGNVLKQSIRS